MTVLLVAMLIAGILFLLIPLRFFKGKEISLKISTLPTEEIKAIILFVGTLKEGQGIEDLLAYKILAQLSGDVKKTPKQVWLIHGDISDRSGSSYYNTHKLALKFKSSQLNIHTVNIESIFDVNEVFSVINRIFDFDAVQLGIKDKDIVCDCTSGTKLMTLGMALACIGGRRLIYFPVGPAGNASEYMEIDAKVFLDTKPTL